MLDRIIRKLIILRLLLLTYQVAEIQLCLSEARTHSRIVEDVTASEMEPGCFSGTHFNNHWLVYLIHIQIFMVIFVISLWFWAALEVSCHFFESYCFEEHYGNLSTKWNLSVALSSSFSS